jgi:hypothetical protein
MKAPSKFKYLVHPELVDGVKWDAVERMQRTSWVKLDRICNYDTSVLIYLVHLIHARYQCQVRRGWSIPHHFWLDALIPPSRAESIGAISLCSCACIRLRRRARLLTLRGASLLRSARSQGQSEDEDQTCDGADRDHSRRFHLCNVNAKGWKSDL